MRYFEKYFHIISVCIVTSCVARRGGTMQQIALHRFRLASFAKLHYAIQRNFSS